MRDRLGRFGRLLRLGRVRRLDGRSLRILLSLGIVVGLGATGTFAAWTDSVVISGTTISTGTIDLKVNNADTVTTFTSMNISTMVPGNSTAGVLTVSNTGTAPLKYFVHAVASNTDGKGLGNALVAKVTGDGSVSGASPSATCAGPALSNTGTTFASNLVASSSPRLLAPGASETLCLQATLLSNAPSSLQNATTTIRFDFTGTSF